MLKKMLPFLLALLVNNSALAQDAYVIDDGNAQLYKVDTAHPNTKILLKSLIGSVGGMVIDNNNGGDIYYTTASNSASSGQIKRVNSDGTNETTIASSLSFPTAITLDPSSNMLYFITTSTGIRMIYKVPKDGSSSPVFVALGDGSGGPVDLELDVLAAKIYWSDSRGSIRRANTDGSGEEVFASGLSTPLSGISVDALNGFVYWIDSSTTSIKYASLSATLPATPLTAVSDPSIGVGGLANDTSTNPVTLYHANANSLVIRATFGGTAQTLLAIGDGAASPTDIDVTFSTPAPAPTATSTPTSSVLNPNTQIADAPIVTVAKKNATITLLNFSSAQSAQALLRFLERAAQAKLLVRYDVRINAAVKKDSQKLLSKKNQLTVKNLKPGNYNVNYSAAAFAKKTKTQIDKAKANGKTGFTDIHKKVFQTNFSPSAGFTILK